jgi:hypothetical protein
VRMVSDINLKLLTSVLMPVEKLRSDMGHRSISTAMDGLPMTAPTTASNSHQTTAVAQSSTHPPLRVAGASEADEYEAVACPRHGLIDLMFSSVSDAVEQMRAGTIKAYAVTAKNRSAAASNILTVDEAGLPGFHFLNWFALFAPKGTPKNVAVAFCEGASLSDPAGAHRRRRCPWWPN